MDDDPTYATQTIDFINDPPYASSTSIANNTVLTSLITNTPSKEKWRVPTILALTIAVGLGSAMAIFLMWVAWRKVGKLRRRIEEEEEAGRGADMIER